MARAGLGPAWECVWANDFSPEKATVYRRNWGDGELVVGDVAKISCDTIPAADMAWGSFPCQDLSLAGSQSGIGQSNDKEPTRSGTFWPFWKIVSAIKPKLVVLENVPGALTSNDGADLRAICSALTKSGYSFGPLVIDAVHWVPQSRQRLFIVAIHKSVTPRTGLAPESPSEFWHSDGVHNAYRALPLKDRAHWIWWDLPLPSCQVPRVEKLIESNPRGWVAWDPPEKTRYLIQLMNERHREKLRRAQMLNRRVIGFAYRRTREGAQRAEVRFDGIAGCLRTTGGGSSRQIVFEVNGEQTRSRLLSPREAARLQGLTDNYWLPDDYNQAYDVVGDGLCVPVVRYLADHLLNHLVQANMGAERATA